MASKDDPESSSLKKKSTLTRRQSLQTAVGAATALSIGSSLLPKPAKAAVKRPSSDLTDSGESFTSPNILVHRDANPGLEEMAMHRIAFGPRPGDVERVKEMGLENYLHEQFHPNDADDQECTQRLADATLLINYGPQKVGKYQHPAVHEYRPLNTLNQSTADLWKLMTTPGLPQPELYRPVDEVIAAKIIRGVYSKWQLREVMTDFWHNHFSIDAYVTNNASMVMFPVFDRDVIRKHGLGNFREMLGDVAKSVPMLVYLNNFESKASPANENFARELFELHTLGAEHYYNALYTEWDKVPGALEGHPVGYVDQDVYEAARAFTGWTFANGVYGRGDRFPNTGEFYYYDKWHDPYQKRVLAQQFDPYQPPMSDGERVLDLVAYHPGTAHFVCKKICKRLVSPNPPESLVKKAVHTWMAFQKDPYQISRVIHTIVMAPEFKQTWAEGIKLPFEVMMGFFRATKANVMPEQSLFNDLAVMGAREFNWPTPNGRPYDSYHWTGTSGILTRWNAVQRWTRGQKDVIELPEPLEMPDATDWDAVAAHWERNILGRTMDTASHNSLVEFISAPFPKGVPQTGDKPYIQRTKDLIAVIAMTPDFHVR